jgi:hypothetical protein
MTCRISLVAVCCSSASAISIRSRCDCAEPAVCLLLARSSSATRFRSCAFSVMSSAFVMDMLHSQGARVRFTPVPSTPPPPAPGRTAWLGPPIGQARARNDAHSRQNFAWGGFSVWHRGHCIPEPPSEPGRGPVGQVARAYAGGPGGVKECAGEMGVESRLVECTRGDVRSSRLSACGLTYACIDRPARPSRQFARE